MLEDHLFITHALFCFLLQMDLLNCFGKMYLNINFFVKWELNRNQWFFCFVFLTPSFLQIIKILTNELFGDFNPLFPLLERHMTQHPLWHHQPSGPQPPCLTTFSLTCDPLPFTKPFLLPCWLVWPEDPCSCPSLCLFESPDELPYCR